MCNHGAELCQLKQLSNYADTSGTQLKLPKTELHHEKIPKYSLLPGCPTILAEAQPRAEHRQKWPALHQICRATVRPHRNFASVQRSFRLNQLVSVHVKHASRKEGKSYIHY